MDNMDRNLPGIVITGASGFIGSNFLAAACDKYRLFCIARRSRVEAKIPEYKNMRWTQVDITNWNQLKEVVRCIQDHYGADYVLHLAGYYDFTYKDNPEYYHTNVEGTKNVLELSKQLEIKHFIFSSSLVRCKFPRTGETIDENNFTSANFPYAASKAQAENLIKIYSKHFPCSIIRLAAVYSDWCEYPPVYAFIKNWTSSKFMSRILAGKGNSAVPYLHIKDLVKMIFKIIEKSQYLPDLSIFNASPCISTSHKQLYNATVRYYFGRDIKALYIPKWLAFLGLAARQMLYTILQKPSFEKLWMIRYIDRDLAVNANKTFNTLDWRPTPRYNLERRLLILVENMKSYPENWYLRNEEAFKHIDIRPNLLISDIMSKIRDPLLDKITDYVYSEENVERFSNYNTIKKETMLWFLNLIYHVLVITIQTKDRKPMRSYAQLLALNRYKKGFRVCQVCDVIMVFGKFISEQLNKEPKLIKYEQEVYDYVNLNLQVAVDEIEEIYEYLTLQGSGTETSNEYSDLFSDKKKMEQIIRQLEDVCKGEWDINSILL